MDTQEQISLTVLPSKGSIQSEPQSQSLYRQQARVAGKETGAKRSEGITSRTASVEIMGFATHIRHLKERLLASSKETDPVDQPPASKNHGEEEPFPAWLR